MPKIEELIRILVWIIGAGLTGAGVANSDAWAGLLNNETVIGAVVVLVAAVWRLVRKLEPVA